MAAVGVLVGGPASAVVGGSSSVTMPAAMAVGQTGLTGSFTVRNTNTPPNETEKNTITLLRLAPSCGSPSTVDSVCPTPDRRVFGLKPSASGAAGTACAGVVFTVSDPDSAGVVTFTPSTPVVLNPPGGVTGSDRCTVTFTFKVRRLPHIDIDPSASGYQTRTNLYAQEKSATGGVVTTRPSLVVTVVPAS